MLSFFCLFGFDIGSGIFLCTYFLCLHLSMYLFKEYGMNVFLNWIELKFVKFSLATSLQQSAKIHREQEGTHIMTYGDLNKNISTANADVINSLPHCQMQVLRLF